jgi:hypothetical protein
MVAVRSPSLSLGKPRRVLLLAVSTAAATAAAKAAATVPTIK